MGSMNPFDTLREADRRHREDHFTLMEEEDELKELENQHDAMVKANKELEALVEAMKLETAAERARGKALKAKEDRLRQRLEDELTEVRRLEKKRQATAEAKAAILAKREETKQFLLTLYENSRTRYEENTEYPRYLEIVETKRLLEEEIQGKEDTIEEQENTIKRMKEEEAEKWKEFVDICIRAAEIWKRDQEENKKQKDLLAQSQRLRLGLQTKKDSTFLTPGYSTAIAAPHFSANRLLGLSSSYSLWKKLPFFRPGNHQKTQESSLSGLYSPEKVRDANSKYDEAMKRLREMRLKSTKAPIPAKRPRPSETDIKSLMGRPQLVHANVRTMDTTDDMETNTEGVSDPPSNDEDMEIVEINTEAAVKEHQSSTNIGYAVASSAFHKDNKEAPSRASSSGFDVSGGLVSDTVSVEAVGGEFQCFKEPCSTNNTRPGFVRPQSRAGHEKEVLSSIENTVEKNAVDPSRVSPLFRQPTPRFRSGAMEPPKPQFGVDFVPVMSTSNQAKGSISTTTSGHGSLLQGKATYPSQTQSQRSNGSSSILSQAESVAPPHMWNDDAGNGIEGGDDGIFQFDGSADNDFSFGGGLDMGNDDDNEPFSFSGEAFSSAGPFF